MLIPFLRRTKKQQETAAAQRVQRECEHGVIVSLEMIGQVEHCHEKNIRIFAKINYLLWMTDEF